MGFDLSSLVALGPSAGVIVVVGMFLKFLAGRDRKFERVIERNTDALDNQSKVSGAMIEALHTIRK